MVFTDELESLDKIQKLMRNRRMDVDLIVEDGDRELVKSSVLQR